MKRKLVFLLYDSRSGSTFFSAMLNRYRGVSVSHEGPYVRMIIEYAQPIQTESDIKDLANYLFSSRLIREMGLKKETVLSALLKVDKPYSKKNLISSIINLYFDQRDSKANVIVLKQSIYKYTQFAINAWPNVRFLHMVRDGRAVLCSKRFSKRFDGSKFQSNVIKSAKEWSYKIEKMELFNELNPGHLHTVKYENLIKEPKKTMAQAVSFLDLSEEETELTKTQQQYAQHIGTTQQEIHKNASKSPQVTKIDKWKRKLPKSEILLYEYYTEDYLKKMGYPLSNNQNIKNTKLYALILKSYCNLAVFKYHLFIRVLKEEPSFTDFLKRRLNRLKFKDRNNLSSKNESLA